MHPVRHALLLTLLFGYRKGDPACPHDLHPKYKGYWDPTSNKCFTWLDLGGVAQRTYDKDAQQCASHFFNGVVAPVLVSYFTNTLTGKMSVHASAYITYTNLPHAHFWEGNTSSWVLNGNRIVAATAETKNETRSLTITLENPLSKEKTVTARWITGNRTVKMDNTGLPMKDEHLEELTSGSLPFPQCMRYMCKPNTYGPMSLTSCTSGNWDGLICASDPLNNCIVDHKKSDDRCVCRRGYTGKYCAEVIDNCAGNPCGSPKYCVSAVDDYFCKCFKGFLSNNCDHGPPEEGAGLHLLITLWVLLALLVFPLLWIARLIGHGLRTSWQRHSGKSGSSSSQKKDHQEGQKRLPRSARNKDIWKRIFFWKKEKIKHSRGWEERNPKTIDHDEYEEDDRSYVSTQSLDSDKTEKRRSVSSLLLDF